MTLKAKLFTFWRSSCSWRVRIAVNLVGADVEHVPVSLISGEQYSEKFRKINPQSQIPAFKTGNLVLTQSVAIMEYLHDLHPKAGLLPSDPTTRAKVRMVTELISSGIQPMQNLSVMMKHSQDQEENASWSKHWITIGFQALEKVLEGTAGKFCVGDNISMADCCLVPQVI